MATFLGVHCSTLDRIFEHPEARFIISNPSPTIYENYRLAADMMAEAGLQLPPTEKTRPCGMR